MPWLHSDISIRYHKLLNPFWITYPYTSELKTDVSKCCHYWQCAGIIGRSNDSATYGDEVPETPEILNFLN